jgi:hypothetical protein
LKAENYITQLKNKFIVRREFTKEELHHILNGINPKLKSSTHNKMIYEWKKVGIIKEILSGIYQLGHAGKSNFIPDISTDIKKIHKIIKREFPLIDYCIWETRWLTNFIHHVPDTNLVIIEAGNESQEFVFNYLFKNEKSEVFLNPSRKELIEKVWNSTDNVIVKNLISRSPVTEVNHITIPKLEKILVDLFCETDPFSSFQGNDRDQIFLFGDEFYVVNWKTANYYADRRGRSEEFKEYLRDLEILPKTFL